MPTPYSFIRPQTAATSTSTDPTCVNTSPRKRRHNHHARRGTNKLTTGTKQADRQHHVGLLFTEGFLRPAQAGVLPRPELRRREQKRVHRTAGRVHALVPGREDQTRIRHQHHQTKTQARTHGIIKEQGHRSPTKRHHPVVKNNLLITLVDAGCTCKSADIYSLRSVLLGMTNFLCARIATTNSST